MIQAHAASSSLGRSGQVIGSHLHKFMGLPDQCTVGPIPVVVDRVLSEGALGEESTMHGSSAPRGLFGNERVGRSRVQPLGITRALTMPHLSGRGGPATTVRIGSAQPRHLSIMAPPSANAAASLLMASFNPYVGSAASASGRDRRAARGRAQLPMLRPWSVPPLQ